MMINNIIKCEVLITIITMIFSCCNPQNSTLQKGNETQNQIETVTDEIKGEYYFKYPSGEIEIIYISMDKSFRQRIYKTEDSYKHKKAPMLEGKGTWDYYGNKLEFQDWIEYCYMGRIVDSILPVHEKIHMMDVYWYNSSKKSKARLELDDDGHYLFTKLD